VELDAADQVVRVALRFVYGRSVNDMRDRVSALPPGDKGTGSSPWRAGLARAPEEVQTRPLASQPCAPSDPVGRRRLRVSI
jgi:hypothetical protein